MVHQNVRLGNKINKTRQNFGVVNKIFRKKQVEHDAGEEIQILAVNELGTNIVSSKSFRENEDSLSIFEDSFISIEDNSENSGNINEGNTFAFMPSGQTQIPVDNVEIELLDAPSHLKSDEIRIEFKEIKESWMSAVYRTYEDDFWYKIKRGDLKKRYKWHYFCNFCQRRYCTFVSLKGHLNENFRFFPFICKICFKMFPLRSSLITHLRQVHHCERREYEHYVTY
uniref:C2H2-type domain-containing protein n=1 Tax=Glossina pallidipes TaxID=7398 RepID=A0A1B0ABW9_GLOPL